MSSPCLWSPLPLQFAQYVRQCYAKLEQVGNANYPEEARGRLYGKVRITLSISADGTLANVEVDQSSGHDVLDKAAVRIAKLASPFAPFPEEIRRDTDILVITRTWTFAPGNQQGTP